MNWQQLLNDKRVKDIGKETESQNHSSDPRSQFQRDYDRCLFSTPVRRLQDKAQVFPLESHDSVRTRLTHSLEVSNVARGIAERIGSELASKEEIDQDQKQDIIHIASTCGLIHDLGNPPFGHAGEDAMRAWFKAKLNNDDITIRDEKQKKDFLNFEGNAQTIRLISKLQMLGDFSGLNLTAGTLATARKYIASSNEIKKNDNQSFKKLGFFQSEKDLLKDIEKATGTGNKRHPITYMVEAADDIVYAIIDLEDALKKGAITWNFLREQLKDLIPDTLNKAEKNIYDRALDQGFNKVDNQNNGNEECRSEFEELNGQAIAEARMSILRTNLIGLNMEKAVDEFIHNYDAIMNGEYQEELVHNNEVIKNCKKIAGKNVFQHPSILKLEIMGRNIIHDLMSHFWKGIEKFPYDEEEDGILKEKIYPFEFKIYTLLSDNYKTVFENHFKINDIDDDKKQYLKLQLLADYICGMTDNFAKELHKEVYNG